MCIAIPRSLGRCFAASRFAKLVLLAALYVRAAQLVAYKTCQLHIWVSVYIHREFSMQGYYDMNSIE